MFDLLVLPALALGLVEILLFSVFFIALVIGTALDRGGHADAPKWWIFVVGGALVVGVYWNHWTFAGIVSLWKLLFAYLGIGLLYSSLEFAFAVRRAARRYGELWAVENRVPPSSNSELDARVGWFILHHTRGDALIGLKQDGRLRPVPVVNREELAACIGVWTLFWPAYLVSLVLGDLFVEVFRVISNLLVAISGRFVRMAFKNIFN